MAHTKDKLAAALREVELAAMARKAEEGYYHDFLSPLATPEMALVADLARAATGYTNREAIYALRTRVIDGEFDASSDESDAWAASPEGQDAFNRLIGRKKRP